jgi:hypothetical protein
VGQFKGGGVEPEVFPDVPLKHVFLVLDALIIVPFAVAATFVAVRELRISAVATAAGIYSSGRQSAPTEQPFTVPLPEKRPTPETGPLDLDQLRGALVARQSGKEIGVPIYMQGSEIGRVTAVWADKKGAPQGVPQRED